MREDVLERIGQLEGIDVAEAILHVRIDDKLCETQNLTAQVEGVSETRLLTLLGGQGPMRRVTVRYVRCSV